MDWPHAKVRDSRRHGDTSVFPYNLDFINVENDDDMKTMRTYGANDNNICTKMH